MIVNTLFLDKIIAEDFRKVLKFFLPTRYYSQHIFDDNRQYERIGHVGYLIILIYFFIASRIKMFVYLSHQILASCVSPPVSLDTAA